MENSKKKRIILVAGARPNFMKIAPVYRELKKYPDMFEVVTVHTGQHYDFNMSDAFFRDLVLPAPDVFLGVGSGSHAVQTAAVMTSFEKTCIKEKPDMVIVVGDVNSTMACAITAAKLSIPVAHIEAGLRSYDRSMPEEINRLVTDCLSDILFTPSKDANENLLREGCSSEKIFFVGNVMIDSLEFIKRSIKINDSHIKLGIDSNEYGLVTLHRPSNVDNPESLGRIVNALIIASSYIKVVFPVHPRTLLNLKQFKLLKNLEQSENIQLLDPLGYADFLNLLMNSRFVLTDSGGLQEETTYLGIPCLTLRPNTERPVTVTEGTNELVKLDNLNDSIIKIFNGNWKKGKIPDLWDGRASERIVDIIKDKLY